MSQNVIELNGKRYDALSGALLGPSTAAAPKPAPYHPAPGRVVDGFFRQPASKPAKHPAAAKAKPTPTKPKSNSNPKPTAPLHPTGRAHAHTPGVSVQRHQPEHSKTLMRSAVHQPEAHLKPAIKPQAPAEIMAKPASALAPKRSVTQVDPARLERAKIITKHGAVQRFESAKTGAELLRHTVQPVGHVPLIAVRQQPAPTAAQPASPQPADIFEAAVKRATSHAQPAVKRRRTHHHRFVNVAAGIAAFLILGGFVAYLNLPNIQLHVASVEAGFHATMPSYRPTGYAQRGGIEHRGGTVSMRFTSGDSSYRITQQSSSWDSQALLDNTLGLAGPHETIQRGGRTVYVYGNGANAAWVTGSVRYDITGNASLSSEELANIAASM